MTNFIDTPHGNTIAYNQFIGKKTGIVFLSGFKSDMKGNKALYIENWAKDNDHSFLRFDYSGHGESSGKIDKKCFSDWYMDAEFLIKKLTKGKQILIGSSMGGWVMLMLAKNLPKKISDAIIFACDDILNNPEKYSDEFPIPIFQTGSGTQTNMNVNEVIANKANEKLGGRLGKYEYVPVSYTHLTLPTNREV